MTPERWQRIQDLFQSALECGSDQRGLFLDNACARDSALKAEVELLLAYQQQAEGFLEKPVLVNDKIGNSNISLPFSSESNLTAASLLGKIINDRYIIEEKIGQGGMGTIYRARDIS